MQNTLEQRPYGNTGERTTVIGLGGAYLDKVSLADGIATVRRAIDLGVTYFDTAPAYCRGASQVIMGSVLEGCTTPHLLATKIGYMGVEDHFRNPDVLRGQLWENLRALRRDQVDILQVHRAELACWWRDGAPEEPLDLDQMYDFADAPVMHVLREAREQGLCRFIGITTDRTDELAYVMDHVDVDVCLAAYDYSMVTRGARSKLLPTAASRGMAYVAAGTLRPVMGGREHMLGDRLQELQNASGLSLVALTMRYLIADPAVATILVGAALPQEIEESVMAARQGPLPSDLHQAIEDLVPNVS